MKVKNTIEIIKMLDNSQFRKKEKSIMEDYPIVISILIFMLITFAVTLVIAIIQMIYYPDHEFSDTVNISQPKIICNNYTIKDDYYYCIIDDVSFLEK